MSSQFTEGISACGTLCCAPAAACASPNEFITSVRLGNGSSSSSSDAGCESDFTSLPPETVSLRSTYPLVVTIANGVPANSVGAWFDWNNNGDFSDSGEYHSLVRDSATPGNFVATIAVPGNAAIGTTRFRVRLIRTGALSPCGPSAFGEVEDYSVDVQPDPCNPGADACGAAGQVYIFHVEIGTTENNSSTDPGCYSDFTSRTPQVVCPGGTFELTIGTGNDNLANRAAAWVDWNRNNSFTDAGEEFILSRTSSGFFTAQIAVPASAPLGLSRVRIRVMREGLPGTLTPCGTTAVGEVEDYRVRVGETTGICCSENGCCMCTGFGTSFPENCTSPGSTYLPCATSCSPRNPCPKPPTLHAILVAGGGRLLPTPSFNSSKIKAALERFSGVDHNNIHMCASQQDILDAAEAVSHSGGPGDTMLFYFAGHGGFCEPTDTGCQLQANQSPVSLGEEEAAHFTVPQNQGMSYVQMQGQSYFASQLAAMLHGVRIYQPDLRYVVIIEACFSGGVQRSLSNMTNLYFVSSSDGGHFSVVEPNPLDTPTHPAAADHAGLLTLALEDALTHAPASAGLPSLNSILSATRSYYHCSTGDPCRWAIGAPTALQDIAVANPVFSLFEAATPGFDGSTPLGSSAPWCGPSLQSHPADARACPTQPTVFSVTHAPATYTYQWRRAGVPITDQPGHIAGATTATLTITGATAADVGAYDCVVTNACGSVTSAPASLTVCVADFNCNGVVAVADIFAFLSAWFAGSPATDVNGNGLTVSDIFTYLGLWFSGCP